MGVVAGRGLFHARSVEVPGRSGMYLPVLKGVGDETLCICVGYGVVVGRLYVSSRCNGRRGGGPPLVDFRW